MHNLYRAFRRQQPDALEKIGRYATQDVGTMANVISKRIEHRWHFVLRLSTRLWFHGLTGWRRSISVIGWSGDA